LNENQKTGLAVITGKKRVYKGCFTTCGHYCRRWFPRSFYQKSSYKLVSDFGRLQSYDRL